MSPTITIPRRFNGPPQSANGGYACGLVAAVVGGPAEVTLRSPPPLDTPLSIVPNGDRVEIRDGETLVAVGEPVEFELDVPESVSVEEAEAARKARVSKLEGDWASMLRAAQEREAEVRAEVINRELRQRAEKRLHGAADPGRASQRVARPMGDSDLDLRRSEAYGGRTTQTPRRR